MRLGRRAIGRYPKLRTWTYNDGRSWQGYVWLRGLTVSLSIHQTTTPNQGDQSG